MDRMVRIAELEIYPDQLDAYKAALKEEIGASIGTESGVLSLYAVSIKDHPEPELPKLTSTSRLVYR
jgi:hypothetical protein